MFEVREYDPNRAQARYDVWRVNVGQPADKSVGATANAVMPEPAALLLLLSGTLAICSSRCQKDRKFIDV